MTVSPCPALSPVSATTVTSQPAGSPGRCPASRSFSVPLITGSVLTETCPRGCVHDHSSDSRDVFLEDLFHRIGEKVSVTVPVFDAEEGTVPMPVLAAQVRVDPYSSDPRLRVPHVNLEPAPDDVMEGLGPVELAAVIAQVRAHCDRLDEVLDRLVAARAEYGA